MNIIGVNAFHGDSSACLFVDGVMTAAAEEERFTRIKHWAGFPKQSIQFCLDSNDLSLNQIDVIAINTDPRAARFKKLQFALSGKTSVSLIKEKLKVRKKRASLQSHLAQSFPNQNFQGKIEYVEHHQAHLASAFNVSPFENAVAISIDGFGDFASAAWGVGEQNTIDLKRRVYFPHSLGIFYQALTQYLGFPNYGDEYKVMGLAPYGSAKYSAEMDQLIQAKSAGTFELNLPYFQHHTNAIGYEWEGGSPQISQLFSDRLVDLLGPVRTNKDPLEQRHKDIAHSIQDAYERTLFSVLNEVHTLHPTNNLTIAGGCGMNSVANGKIHLHTPFNNIYVQSAAGDAGGAIGAAIVAGQRHAVASKFDMKHAYWGPEFDDQTTKAVLQFALPELEKQNCDVLYDQDLTTLTDQVSDLIIQGKVIGWFQGAMEWGPRALGNRSILGDPRRQDMQDILNIKIKRRESFRPFAPSVMREHVNEWFESDADVPFMMKVFQIKQHQRTKIPAVTHVDGSGRLQTVTDQSNHSYYQLISAFHKKTGVPMLLNTSFNENEPVVCKPQEALDCFLRTNIDVLVLGPHIVVRTTDEPIINETTAEES